MMMKKFHAFSRGVTALHTHTHTHSGGIQRIRAFVLILFLLMMKVDVGWGQGGSCNNCTNSISNNNVEMDLEVNPVNGKGQASFQYGFVSNWYSAFNTPHHIQYNPTSNPVICDLFYANSNNTEIPCLATHKSGYSEGIFTNSSILFANDGFETYCISLDVQKLLCSNYNHEMVVDVRLGTGIDPWQIGNIDNQAVNLFNNNTLILHSEAIDNNDLKSINLTFDLNQNSNWYDQVMINTRKPVPTGAIREEIFVTLNNVNVSCSTTALEGLSAVILPNNNVEFSAVYNAGAFNGIDTYFWNFGDGTTSTLANPSHQFNGPGPYNVCLDIVNTNGCCASICRTITAEICDNTCDDQIVNNDLDLGPNTPNPLPTGQSETTFQNLYVPNGPNNMWWASHGTPQHTQFQAPECIDDWSVQNGSEVPCLRAAVGLLSEGVYTRINTNFDPLLDYCLSLTLHNLACNNTPGSQDVIVALAKDLTPVPPNVTLPNPPSIPRQVLIQRRFDSPNYQEETVNVRFNMNQNMFNQLWIYAQAVTFKTTSSVSNVNLSCTTRALTDINTDQVMDLKWRFIAENASTVSTFVSHNWTITNTADNSVVFTSIQANPEFIFSGSGTYNVCVDIIDNNGCCATLCEEIVVACDVPVANFTIAGECPNFTFFANNIDENHTYSWVINGQQVGTNGVLPFSFTENGVFTIELFVTNECGDIARSTITLEVDCICEPPLRDFNMTLVCNGGVGNSTFTVLNGQPGDSYTWNFGDGTANVTTSLVTTAHTYTSNGLFTVTLVVTNECGETQTITRTLNVTCVPPSPLCARYLENGGFFLDGGVIPVNFVQYVTQNNVPHTTNWWFNNQIFVIRGNVIMDRNLVFVGCTFLFEGGASLELNNTFKSQNIVFSNSILQACDNVMWKGVKSINGNHRFVFGTTIQDAEYGIEMSPTSLGYISVNNAKLLDNIIGIFVANNSGNNIRNTLFSSTRSSNLGAYSGQVHHFARPKAGILFQNTNGVLGTDASPGNNIFSRLDNGVLADNSNLTCVGNSFFTEYGLGQDFSIPDDPFMVRQTWIWIKKGSNHIIAKNSIKAISDYTPIFFHDINGGNILMEKNEVIANYRIVNFNKVRNSNQITIRQHRKQYFPNGGFHFEASLIGIGNQCSNNKIEIYENDFFKSRANQCISIDYADDILLKSIRQNYFNLNFGTNPGLIPSAISVSSSSNINIESNIIENYGLNPRAGIFLFNCKKMNIIENEVTDHVNGLPAAILYETDAEDVKLECNQIFGAPIGFNFKGNNHTNIDFKSNLMHLNDIGIQVQGVFTAQRDKGNLWVGDDIGGKSYAKHLSGGSNTWFVNNLQTPPASFPTGRFRPVTVEPNDWFDDRDVQNIHCFGGREEGEGDGNTPQAKAMELAAYLTDEVEDTPLLQWEWQTSLYELLTDHPALMDANELLATLYNEMLYNKGIYKDAFDELSDLLALTELETTTLNNVRSTMEQIQAQLNALRALTNHEVDLESEGNANEIPNGDEIYDQMKSLSNQLSVLKNNESTILSDIQSRVNEALDNYIAETASLPETEVFHPAFKTMMGIKANMYRHGMVYIANNHIAQLESIAALCYAGYGWAAAEAVSMLNILGHNLELNYGSCEELENRNSLSSLDNKTIVQIYPNPATDRITIAASGHKVSSVVVKSMDGSVQKSLTCNAENGCDISSLPLGIFLVDVVVDGKYLSTVKFIKIK